MLSELYVASAIHLEFRHCGRINFALGPTQIVSKTPLKDQNYYEAFSELFSIMLCPIDFFPTRRQLGEQNKTLSSSYKKFSALFYLIAMVASVDSKALFGKKNWQDLCSYSC